MIFIDTSVFIAFLNERDEDHRRATKLMDEISKGKYGKPLISTFVFSEIVTVALLKLGFRIAHETGNQILNSDISILDVREEIFKFSWDKFGELGDMGFVDCTIIAIKEKYNIEKVATFDKKFKGRVDVVDS